MNIQTVTFENVSFVNVTNPGELELKYLKNNFGFDTLHLDDYLNKTQIPKVEIFKNYSLLVLDFPFVNLDSTPQSTTKTDSKPLLKILGIPILKIPAVPLPQFTMYEKKKRLHSAQVYFFIGKDYLVVLHDGTLSIINDIFAQCQKTLRNRRDYMAQGPIFLSYRIIDALVDKAFPIMNDLSATIDRIDRELEYRQSQDTLEDISLIRRNIVVFQTIIKPILLIFRHLEEGRYNELNGSMGQFWSNILDHLQKIWDRLEDSQELIEGISESNESLLSYRSNELVKFLTIITSISFPFVIINNLYSMNVVGLPYATKPWIIWALFGVIFLGAVAIILYFKKRKWI